MQSVWAAPHDISSAIVLQCSFITGSDARGCFVTLQGEFDNVTINLTRDGSCAFRAINTANALSNFTKVFGFDVESDGSVGDLAVPGVILMDVNMMPLCIKEPTAVNLSTGECVDYLVPRSSHQSVYQSI